MNPRIISKNHAADQEIEFITKSISKPNGCARAMPTVWELIIIFILNFYKFVKPFFIDLMFDTFPNVHSYFEIILNSLF